MRQRVRPSTLLAPVVLALLTVAMVHPVYAERQSAHSGVVSTIAGTGPLAPPAAAQAFEMPRTNGRSPGLLPNPAAPPSEALIKPIIAPSPIPVRPVGPVNAPGTYVLQATTSSVSVKWYDRSDNELGFRVFRRDTSGNWQMVYQVASRDMHGFGTGTNFDYTWVDTSTNISGQCYKIAAYNITNAGDTAEECTVRPDPSRFPQTVSVTVPSWSGLSDTNDGTGSLVNTDIEQNLKYGERTWGVNLTWGNSSLWRVEAQGGPHLMKGQAVALKVWGGGWLKYGNQTFGVDLQLSATPVYEWYAIGLKNDPSKRTWAGSSLTDGGSFALWNSSAHLYLVPGYQTWGIGLQWYDGALTSPAPTPVPTHGVKTERVLNCSVDQQPVEVWIADQTAGGGFVDKGRVDEQYGSDGCPTAGSVPLTFSPLSGHHYLLVATDSALPGCDGSNDPQQGECQKMTVQFDGDANGFTRTDIVDDGTVITP